MKMALLLILLFTFHVADAVITCPGSRDITPTKTTEPQACGPALERRRIRCLNNAPTYSAWDQPTITSSQTT